ncbi:MAG: alpha/beta hydrolase [Nocardiopsaceae bacterium]|jgi:pimeloyl-ACP methyl ester carboxylesterase|nr:alpha/beta hydrolase [Nocardiopsaceae bacterium]
MTREAQLSSGTIEYQDAGAGPVVVLIHGAHMNASVWDRLTGDLSADHRCVVPTLPLGGHRRPMSATADLSPVGVAALLGELLEALDLDEVTLVGNDTGGALAQLLVTQDPHRIARLVLASCDAFDNFPPGLPGRVSALAGRMPGGMLMAGQLMRWNVLARLPLTWGWMAKRPIAQEMLDAWFTPLRAERRIRRDAARFMRSVDRRDLLAAADQLPSFGRPALIVWAAEDRVMPPEHAQRLASRLPDARIAMVPDSYTLIPLDQPQRLAAVVREFVKTT